MSLIRSDWTFALVAGLGGGEVTIGGGAATVVPTGGSEPLPWKDGVCSSLPLTAPPARASRSTPIAIEAVSNPARWRTNLVVSHAGVARVDLSPGGLDPSTSLS